MFVLITIISVCMHLHINAVLLSHTKEVPKLKLSDGNQIPVLGFGTFLMNGDRLVRDRITDAINTGYRHIDTAMLYDNEVSIGRAINNFIQKGFIKRGDIFITSKVWNTYHSRHRVVEGIRQSLRNLNLNYLDLALIHWPTGWAEDSSNDCLPRYQNRTFIDSGIDYLETWKGMEDAVRDNLTKSIGVSNFNRRQLRRLLDAAEIKPVINQVESNPYLIQENLLDFCKNNSIVMTAYSPLGHGNQDLLRNDRVIRNIADRHNKSMAQVMIKFQLQRECPTFPKTSHSARVGENFNVFDFTLSDRDMQILNGLNRNLRAMDLRGNERHRYYPFNEE